jgi:hypothetical protein
MPDPLFQTLFNETDTMTWAPVDVLRERAHRRARRTQGIAVAAVVVAVGAISGGVAVAPRDQGADPQLGRSQPATGPTPSSPTTSESAPSPSVSVPPTSAAPRSPSPATAMTIGNALFLQPSDVGPGYRVVSGQEASGDWIFEFSASALGCQASGLAQSPNTTRVRTLSRGTPQAEDALTQYVARYRSGDAAQYLDRVRAQVNACTPATGQSIKIGAQHFAGQDALLIEVNYGDGVTTKHVVIRQGDLLTEFFTKPERSSAAAKELGRKAAHRLCGATPTC